VDDDVVTDGDPIDQRQGDLLAYAAEVDQGHVVVEQFLDLRGNGEAHRDHFSVWDSCCMTAQA